MSYTPDGNNIENSAPETSPQNDRTEGQNIRETGQPENIPCAENPASADPIKESVADSHSGEEQSTIFGESPTKSAYKPSNTKNRKKLKSLLSAVLTLVLLVGAIFAVVQFIPETEDKTATHVKVPLSGISNAQVESVTITRPTFTSTYRTTVTQSEDDTADATVTWSIDGIDSSLTESTAISYMMDTALRMDAMRQMDKEEGADYGFATPLYKIEAKGYDSANDLTILIGNKTPSGDAYYATADDLQTLYIVEASDVETLDTTDEELGNLNVLYAAEGEDEKYFANGSLSSFDTITLQSKQHGQMVFRPNGNEKVAQYMAYLMTVPVKRYADNTAVTELMNPAVSGLSAESIYKYNPSAADISAYGFGSPDLTYSLKYGDKEVYFKAVLRDDGYYAVMTNLTDKVIYKVAADSIPYAENEAVDFASEIVFSELISDFDTITFNTAKGTTVFGITVTVDEDDNEDISVTSNGKEIPFESFSNYYQYLVGCELNEFAMTATDGTPVLTVSAHYADGSGMRELRFIKHSDRRYYVESDATPAGYISSAYMDKMLDYLTLAAVGDEVPSLN